MTVEPGSRRHRLSIVIPMLNEEASLPALFAALRHLRDSQSDFSCEFILVDDGSWDRTAEALDAAAADPDFKIIHLSRNFGQQAAITAGIDHADGDALVIADADLQDPLTLVPEMMRKFAEGYDVVNSVRTERQGESFYKRRTAALFYWLMGRLTSSRLPILQGDFRLMSRRVVEVLKRLPERHRYLRGLVAWAGFKQTAIPYERPVRRAGETHYSNSRMIALALDAILSFSWVPLRAAFLLGLLCMALSATFLFVNLLLWIFTDLPVRGWLSLASLIVLMGGLNLVMAGVMGEYVGRIFDESKGRPRYIVSATCNLGGPSRP
ncbi:MAG TPA: glycosyltransferase family 2 protein [Verrucomicrobiae bacterium]|nr:glycosyltransferase family 2 protein [Verrucomicrobiae bacterium]